MTTEDERNTTDQGIDENGGDPGDVDNNTLGTCKLFGPAFRGCEDDVTESKCKRIAQERGVEYEWSEGGSCN